MRKLVFVLVVLLMAACSSKPTATPSPTAAPTPTPVVECPDPLLLAGEGFVHHPHDYSLVEKGISGAIVLEEGKVAIVYMDGRPEELLQWGYQTLYGLEVILEPCGIWVKK